MKTLMDLFNEAQAAKEKEAGMDRAARSKAFALSLARRIAHSVALERENHTVSSDDIYETCAEVYSLRPGWLGNAAGSVFGDDMWVKVEPIKSRRTARHASMIWSWMLKPSYWQQGVVLPDAAQVQEHLKEWQSV